MRPMPDDAAVPPPRANLPPAGRCKPRWRAVIMMIAVIGIGPLCLYIAFGPADGHPIGLGLLAMVAAPAAAVCALAGLAQRMISHAAQAARGR